MKAYISIIITRFKASIQYRTAAIARFYNTVFFRRSHNHGNGNGCILFVCPNYSFNFIEIGHKLYMAWPGPARNASWNIDRDIQASIRNGNVVYDFSPSSRSCIIWYGNSLAWRVSLSILRAMPLITITVIYFRY